MATISLGTVAFTYKGAYSGSETYSEQDVATYDGTSYVCTTDGTSGEAPISQNTTAENQLPMPPVQNFGFVVSIANDKLVIKKQDVSVTNGTPAFSGSQTDYISNSERLDVQWGYTYWFDLSDSSMIDGFNYKYIGFYSDTVANGGALDDVNVEYSVINPGSAGAYAKITVPYGFSDSAIYVLRNFDVLANANTYTESFGGTVRAGNPDEYIVNYAVTIDQNASDEYVFVIDGVRQDTLYLQRGYEYIFDQTDSSNTIAGQNTQIKFYSPIMLENGVADPDDDTPYGISDGFTHTAGTEQGVTSYLVPLDSPSTIKYGSLSIYGSEINITGGRTTTITQSSNWAVFGQGINTVATNVGDLIYFDGSDLKPLPVGAPNTVLTVNAEGMPSWKPHQVSSSYRAWKFPDTENTNLYRRGTVMMEDGTLRWWGVGGNYMSGRGNEVYDRSYPIQTPMYKNSPKFKSYTHDYSELVFAIDENDEVWTWGYQTDGEAGIGNTSTGTIKVPRYISGDSNNSIYGKRIKKIIQGVGNYSDNKITVMLDTDGDLHISGYNGHGQLAGLTNTGYFQELTGITEEIVDVKVGRNNQSHILALTVDGEVYAWGHNEYGQLGHGTSGTGVFATLTKIQYFIDNSITIAKIHVGGESSFAIDTNGELYSWGYNGYGNLGRNGTTTNAATYVPASCLSGVAEVFARGQAGDYETSHAIKTDGSVWSCGSNNYGSLGVDESTTNRATFVEAQKAIYTQGIGEGTYTNEPFTNAVKIRTGGTGSYNRTFVLDSDGKLWSVGYGGNGGLGTGTTDATNYWFREIPIHGKVIEDFHVIGNTSEGGCIMKCTDGSVFQFGYAGGSQLPEDDDEYITVPMPIRFA